MYIKKLLVSLVFSTAIVTSSQAGAIIDIEVGGGMHSTEKPTGVFESAGVDVDLASQANLGTTSDNSYMWLVFDHPVPLIPNLRLEQNTLKSSGSRNALTISALNIDSGVNTELDMSSVDVIFYWGVPFATYLPFLDEVDFGIGIKSFTGALTMQESLTATSLVNESFDGSLVPYGYAKVRVEPPFMMGVGFEAELKYLELNDPSALASFSEVILKLNWGLEAPLPILDIEAGVEAGYRMMSLNIESSELETDIKFNGIFFGIYGKFGI